MSYELLKARLQARLLSLTRHLARLLRHPVDPYPKAPEGIFLSPSRAHFAEYEEAPLALSWPRAGRDNPLAWQEKARTRLAELVGYRRPPASSGAPPAAEHVEDSELPGGFRRRRLFLRVGAFSHVPVTLVWREETVPSRPVMLCLHGHNSGAHLSWGEVRMPDDYNKIAKGADYALQAAARGYMAVCVEQACFGERREKEIEKPSPRPCIDAAHHALLLGRTLLGERVSDVSAVIDWLEAGAGRPEPVPGPGGGQIHAMGNSSGGATGLFAAALDARISGVMASGCVGPIRATIARRAACPDAIVPGILDWMETADILRLCAPRVVLVVSGVKDHIYPFSGAEEAVMAARDVYRALGAEMNLGALAGPEGHRFYPDQAWPVFMDMTKAGESAPVDKKPS